MSDQASRRRSMVGAPPTKRAHLEVPQKVERKRGKAPVVEEEETNTNTVEESSENSEEEVTTESQPKDGEPEATNNSPSRKRRKKRRTRLTDFGSKSKKRRERAAERSEAPEKAESPRKEKEPAAEEEPIIKPKKFEDYQPLQLLCDRLVRNFMQKDPDEYFTHPVSPSAAPDYFSIIDTPMDFLTMRKKVDNNEYASVEELKKDVGLIIENALSYNKPNTIYYLAAQKLQTIFKYYFSETYLEYLRYALPFGNEIPHDLMGLKPKVPVRTVAPTKKKDAKTESLKAAICDVVDTKSVLKQANSSIRDKLSEQKPNWHLGYLDKKKEGPISLNILTGDEKCSITLGDLIGRLDKGTACLPSEFELYNEFDSTVSYTNYGPFASFAPQFDSTWATLSKRDSDLLMACYGDKQNTVDALTLRQMASDTSECLLRAVDGLLDTLTDGEHSRTMRHLEGEPEHAEDGAEDVEEKTEVAEPVMRRLLDELSSLENLGLDMSYLKEIRERLGLEEDVKPNVDAVLDASGQMIADLHTLQQNRLAAEPPLNLQDLAQPSQSEAALAGRVVQQLTNGVAEYGVQPAQVISPQAIHHAIDMADDGCDLDVLGEFFDLS